VVLGLPRGGVPVAAEVAKSLHAPLDVIVIRKLGVPWQPELAFGAVGEDGVRVLNDDIVRQSALSDTQLAEITARELHEVAARAAAYRGSRPHVPVHGLPAIVVDDGVATGATARAACQVARAHGASYVVLAVPVAPSGWERRFGAVADEYVAVETPRDFFAVGAHYRDFQPTTDDEVVTCLASGPREPAHEQQVTIRHDGALLAGTLIRPSVPHGVVVFAHGSGSSHRSVRNRLVARRLVSAGFATALVDLLTETEAMDRANVFDIDLLTERLLVITRWAQRQRGLGALPLGYFGASTGAAAAMGAAAAIGDRVAAVVSRGGRPDLARASLSQVVAPTLLIVGGADDVVHELNERALRELSSPGDLVVIAGATHLFAEPGALESVADLAAQWFDKYLV
jgi:predicted phosphoribosyltransferase/dienelactone hydrolase